MPHLRHPHKSMLLRGVKFPTPALDQADIEVTRGRAAHSGRGHGGAPLRGGYGNGRDRDSFNYASSSTYPRQQFQGQQSYNIQHDYSSPRYPHSQTPNWHPPPPGVAGFPRGPPTLPPSGYPPYSFPQPYEMYPNTSGYSQYQHDGQPLGNNGPHDRRGYSRNGHTYGQYEGFTRY
jgi:5'-3' exoribonuclease 2